MVAKHTGSHTDACNTVLLLFYDGMYNVMYFLGTPCAHATKITNEFAEKTILSQGEDGLNSTTKRTELRL